MYRDAPTQPRLQPGDDGAARHRDRRHTCRGRDGPQPPVLAGHRPVAAVNSLGALVYNAAAKDTRINEAAKVNGVLDDRFGRVPRDAPGVVSLGGRYTLSRWPENASWDFVAVGRGHDVDWWADFLRALEKVDPQMAVNIEHEDQELDQMEGLRSAAATLLKAADRV